ncbi:hypothetical protein IDJ75_11765 [Mucilaginibacter rigui]|uniref:Bacteriophage abortive infection AbiH n=1 Tax=Mucilaginibacter rigui TaxID=534635 RepID=A0ABR7X5W2_9SPHI|nr:AbiH family protein [Mucilaginibacter rigui]MBD1385959.1 hypothetical protein [Mucilaginibacter rigui]
MNRLILIGNGFDLAHGLKTCYKDFIYWYIQKSFVKANNDGIYKDRLITITTIGRKFSYYEEEQLLRWIDEYLSKIEHPKRRKPGLRVGWSDSKRIDMSPFEVHFESNLLEPILSSCNVSNWVDIEGEYYELLKDILEMKDTEARQPELVNLNESLSFIISQLEEYLSTLPVAPFLEGYKTIFSSAISGGDLYPKRSEKSVSPNQTYVLNFNYTNTAEQYVKRIKVSGTGLSPVLNYIHGKLQDIDNELIFGFGDETDSAYKRMEDDIKVKGYFDYIKSFWYLRTDNYRSLVNFLDSEDYQVYVLGHSCGLSDRTMLQMIFEHQKCRSIKIFFHEHNNDDNFVSLTHEIARHFTDKGLMRKKIKSKRGSTPMPQHDDRHADQPLN